MSAMRKRRETRRGRTTVSKASHKPPATSPKPNTKTTTEASISGTGSAINRHAGGPHSHEPVRRRASSEAKAAGGFGALAFDFHLHEASSLESIGERRGVDRNTHVARVQLAP